MVTGELLREAHDSALASLNDAQRAAVERMMDARTQSTFSKATAEARQARRFRADAAALNRQLLRLPTPLNGGNPGAVENVCESGRA